MFLLALSLGPGRPFSPRAVSAKAVRPFIEGERFLFDLNLLAASIDQSPDEMTKPRQEISPC
jgi:hypothetical protein